MAGSKIDVAQSEATIPRRRALMMMKRLFAAAFMSAAVLAFATPSSAATIPLQNTGASQGHGDSANNWELISWPSSDPIPDVLVWIEGLPSTYTAGFGETTISNWITPDPILIGTGSHPVGDYTYRTTFYLDGLDHTTAIITGRWSSDNAGIEILLNGGSGAGGAEWIGPTGGTQFNMGFVDFSFALVGFNQGLNTLDFVVNNATGNGYNPTALRVEMTGTARQVPDGGTTLALLGGALLGLGAVRRRFNL